MDEASEVSPRAVLSLYGDHTPSKLLINPNTGTEMEHEWSWGGPAVVEAEDLWAKGGPVCRSKQSDHLSYKI